MKLLHLADLHLGKRVNGFSMLDDQSYILSEILALIDTHAPQAVMIAGDVYDRAVPSEEAVGLFDRFLVELSARGLTVFVISGNHDSAERIAFGGRLMEAQGVHVAPVYRGTVEPIVLEDALGEVAFYLLPFLKPAQVRPFFPDCEITSETAAMHAVVEALPIDPARRNIAIAHQFVTGASLSGSEELAVGGLDAVEASVFAPFDYVALGHLHGAQRVGSERVRYAGSPLKYAVAESGQHKSVTLVTLGDKGALDIELLPLHPKRDVMRFRGDFDTMMARRETCEDYCEVILTDEEDVPGALSRLRTRYPYLMQMGYDNTRTRSQSVTLDAAAPQADPAGLFGALYEAQNGQPMSEMQKAYLDALIAEIWEEEV